MWRKKEDKEVQYNQLRKNQAFHIKVKDADIIAFNLPERRITQAKGELAAIEGKGGVGYKHGETGKWVVLIRTDDLGLLPYEVWKEKVSDALSTATQRYIRPRDVGIEVLFRKYYYENKTLEWEIVDSAIPNRFAMKSLEQIKMKVEEDIDQFAFSRTSDEPIKEQEQSITITNTRTGKATIVPSTVDSEMSAPLWKLHRIYYEFKKGDTYDFAIPYVFPPCMRKDYDYISMTIPVYTDQMSFSVKFPSSLDLDRYVLDCFVTDFPTYVRIKNLPFQREGKNLITVKNQGPFLKAEIVYFKYSTRD